MQAVSLRRHTLDHEGHCSKDQESKPNSTIDDFRSAWGLLLRACDRDDLFALYNDCGIRLRRMIGPGDDREFTMAILSCAHAMWAVVAAKKSSGSTRRTMQMNTWLRGGKFQCVTDVSAKCSGILSESGPKGLSCRQCGSGCPRRVLSWASTSPV